MEATATKSEVGSQYENIYFGTKSGTSIHKQTIK